ncbi:cyclic amp-dependent transcription factor atf-2 isoform x1 [Stemphylium lycopersici]|uniref:Cyclic amp-dependent transcription factor atf-2 isoform x1 n=1 Tax=Stemphylium lycopersici TaxID=183478 RepID=A0A364MXL5_STELY|nr:cyclic amp-dependent transcription factor atf-2 isoform x1 [Stemphylium lycopersici]
MTTTILIPPHNTSLEDPEIYHQTLSIMSRDLDRFTYRFPSDNAPASNSDYHHDPRHDIQEQRPYHVWNPPPSPIRPPTNVQSTFDSDTIINTSQSPPAIINPAALSNPMFTPMNSAARVHDPAATISPSQTHFDTNVSPSAISESEQSRRDSMYSREEDSKWRISRPQPIKGRKRTTEHIEPGSARAIYLEKNRKAASKCRKKQKAEQEALAEKSRDCDATNRLLRAEKQMLQNEVQELKALLGQHVDCPDQRIARWLQMEADRLASSPRYRP